MLSKRYLKRITKIALTIKTIKHFKLISRIVAGHGVNSTFGFLLSMIFLNFYRFCIAEELTLALYLP